MFAQMAPFVLTHRLALKHRLAFSILLVSASFLASSGAHAQLSEPGVPLGEAAKPQLESNRQQAAPAAAGGTASAAAQPQTPVESVSEKFPLKPGEWEAFYKGTGPMARSYKEYFCLNDETWADLLTRVDDGCSIHPSSFASGLVATEECKIVRGFNMQIAAGTSAITTNQDETTGRIEINFDGMVHMTGVGSFDTDNRTFRRDAAGVNQIGHNGPFHSDIQTDYRWKKDQCGKKDKKTKPAPQSSVPSVPPHFPCPPPPLALA